MSGGMTERQLQLITDFQPDAIMVTPSYMLTLVDAMERAGIDSRGASLQTGVFGAEPWTEQMRTELEHKLDMNAVDIYGLSEVITFSRPRHGSPHTSPPKPDGAPSTHAPTSPSSAPEPGSRRASSSSGPTNQEMMSKSHDTPIHRDDYSSAIEPVRLSLLTLAQCRVHELTRGLVGIGARIPDRLAVVRDHARR